ncbi:MAG: ATP-binding cassette domain-containing protein [Negativicutes bacterium]|jgi:putative ABC transport system ATP-binding protein|nr:ATP-binding cassette domain-containing protein [Negativicutes bacterium]MBP9949634.1 ATP-binding cassette domain-containing protein [Negativicutes bacterium]
MMKNNKEILKIENLNLEIGTVKILKDISFTVQKKEIIALLGPSGSGKSSLLKSINMLNTPSCGQIKYHNNDIQEISPMALRKKIGYVLQKPTLFGNDVMENLKYPCELHQKVFDINLVEFYLKKVNLKPDILEKKPNELSGGEQQRISLVRTLLLEPEIILLDEVTSALDEDNTLLIEELIKYENENNELTVIFISHNNEQAKRLAQKVIYMEEGVIKEFTTVTNFFKERIIK